MSDSYLDKSNQEFTLSRARGYTSQNGNLKLDEIEDISRYSAAGAIVSTTNDLLRFSGALKTEKLLSKASRLKLLEDLSGNNYFGCKNLKIPTGDSIQIFEGGMPGCSSLLVRVNDGEYTVVLLANLTSVPTQRIMRSLLMTILK